MQSGSTVLWLQREDRAKAVEAVDGEIDDLTISINVIYL